MAVNRLWWNDYYDIQENINELYGNNEDDSVLPYASEKCGWLGILLFQSGILGFKNNVWNRSEVVEHKRVNWGFRTFQI